MNTPRRLLNHTIGPIQHYKGTFPGESLKIKVVPTMDHIEKLKTREQIYFFEVIFLFEDEPHDLGVSSLCENQSNAFQFFPATVEGFLRIDEVLIRTNDMRLYHEADKYVTRIYVTRALLLI